MGFTDYVSEHQIEHGNIYVKDGKIAAISAELLVGDAKETIDATGRLVFPGFIDTHCHSRDGSKGAWYKEDFAHSSRAAAVGGITTILEMPNCNPAIYNVENLHDLIKTITPKAYVDFGVWGLCLGKLNNDSLQALADAGVVAFKFFWGYAIDAKNYQLIYNYEEGMKDVIPPMGNGEVYQMFRAVAKTGKLVGIHAEDFSIIKELTNEDCFPPAAERDGGDRHGHSDCRSYGRASAHSASCHRRRRPLYPARTAGGLSDHGRDMPALSDFDGRGLRPRRYGNERISAGTPQERSG